MSIENEFKQDTTKATIKIADPTPITSAPILPDIKTGFAEMVSGFNFDPQIEDAQNALQRRKNQLASDMADLRNGLSSGSALCMDRVLITEAQQKIENVTTEKKLYVKDLTKRLAR